MGAEALHPKAAGIECLARADKRAIGVSRWQAHLTIIGTEEGNGVPRAIILRMSHQFHAELVVTHLSEAVAIAKETVELINTTEGRNR